MSCVRNTYEGVEASYPLARIEGELSYERGRLKVPQISRCFELKKIDHGDIEFWKSETDSRNTQPQHEVRVLLLLDLVQKQWGCWCWYCWWHRGGAIAQQETAMLAPRTVSEYINLWYNYFCINHLSLHISENISNVWRSKSYHYLRSSNVQ